MYKKFRSLEDPRTLITIPINTKELLRFETSKNIIFNQNHHTPQDFAKMRDEYLHELIDINQNAAFEYLQESFQIFDPGVQKVRK